MATWQKPNDPKRLTSTLAGLKQDEELPNDPAATAAATPPPMALPPRGTSPQAQGAAGKAAGVTKSSPVNPLALAGKAFGKLAQGTPAGIAANVATSVLSALPTAQSKANNTAIRDLQNRNRQGVGLTGTEREGMYAEQMNPVRTASTQLANATAAAVGRGGGAADLARVREEQQRAVAGAARQAGDRVATAENEARLSNKAELEQRLAAKAQRTTDLLTGVGKAFMGTAEEAGATEGSGVKSVLPAKGTAPAGTNPDEEMVALEQAGRRRAKAVR